MKNASIVLITAIATIIFGMCGTASAQWSEAVPVDEVNTGNQEGWPVLSFDGLTLYFGRRVSNVMKIYEATRGVPSGPFSSVREILRSTYHLVPGWVSPDNLRMYYHNELPSTWVVKVSERASEGDPWPTGTNVSEINALGIIGDHSLTADELMIFFTGNRLPANLGVYDLWMASRPDRMSPFGNVRNLSELNTTASDADPYITPDGLTLYFGSGRTGTGQIFRASRSSVSETFSSPEQVLIPGVPAAGSPALSADGKTLYFIYDQDIYVSYLEEGDDGLVGHWKFDEGGGSIAYDSAGDNDGVVLGATWADGVLGGGLDFDGVDDGVALPDNSPVWLPEYDFTCSVWVYFDTPASVSGYSTLLDLNATGSSDPINDIGCSVKRLDSGEVIFSFNTIPGVTHNLYSNEVLTEGQWYHIVASRDGTNQAIYVNGSLDSTGICLDGQIDYTGGSYDDDGVSIGRSTSTNSPNGIQHIDGKMDDVRIYDRALSAGEIAELHGVEPGDGLVAHWKFDEGGGAIAYDSAGGNDGVVYGAQWVDGFLGGALEFDGINDYMAVPDDPSMRVNQSASFSVSAWVKPSAGGWLLSKMRANERHGVFGYSLAWEESTSRFRYIVEKSWSTLSTSLYSSAVPSGSWHHVTIIYDNKDKKIYVNGDLHNSDRFDRDTGSTEPDKHFVVGARSWDYTIDGHFRGSIDDVRFYSLALSAGEVEELYGLAPYDGLVGHWKFDEGGGAIAYDSAGDNDGVVLGADWVDGVLDGALDFDGVDDGVALPDNSPVWLPEYDFTCSAWVYFDAPADGADNEVLLDLDFTASSNPANDNGCIVLRNAVGVAFFGMTTITNTDEKLYSNRVLTQGEWYHVVALRRGTTQAIYVNGDLDISRVCSASRIDYSGGSYDNDGVSIGRITTNNSPNGIQYIGGMMDDVRIYDVALSAGEVLRLYEDVPEPPEAVVYHVDGAGGSDFNDGLSRGTAFATIQKGIDSSIDGGEVVVWPGVYSEAINFFGKAITVRSGGDAAVIQAPGMDAVTFHSGEGAGSVLKNFVIRNSGLAISANYGSSPTLSHLTIVDNDYGIAAYEDSNPDISNCILWDNRDGDMWGCQARHSFVEQEIETGPVDGLIGHWRFDEGGGTTAGDSAGSSHGDISGAQWVMGELGGALSFDGVDDYVSILDSGVFDVNGGDISMSMWFKTSEYADQTLMKFRQYDDDPLLEVYTSTVFGNIGSRAMPGGAIVAYNAGRIDDGAWHHVAVSLENGTTGGYKLYLDGMLVGMATFSGDLSGWEAIAIGNDADDGGFFNGSIDDVRVYSRAISSLDAYLLYEMSRGGPVAHWKFDEGAGSIAYDSAGSNDGVIYGAQWAAGQLGGALDFDGVGDYVAVSDNDSLDVEGLTIGVWVKVNTLPPVASYLLAKCEDLVNEESYRISFKADGKIYFGGVDNEMDTAEIVTEASSVIVPGQWQFVAVSYDQGEVHIYVDGVEYPTSVEPSLDRPLYVGTGRLALGARYDRSESTYKYLLDGTIDAVQIYDRALSAGEVELLYDGGFSGQDDVDTIRPLFAGAGDYHLLSERGRYWPDHDVWVLDKVSSPCIDHGDPAIEPSAEPMPNGGVLNIGAYGRTAYASMSEWPIFSDYNRSGRADFGDFAIFCDEWLLALPWAE